MSKEQATHRSGPGKKLIVVVLGVLVVVGLYYGVRWGFRQYTDNVIQGVVGQQLPAFKLRDLDGREHSEASLAGKTVMLNFFRSRCSGCISERDSIKRLVADLDPEKTTALGVMMDRVQGYPDAVTQRTLEEFGYAHPIVLADQEFVDAFHGVGWSHITPITYVVDPKGRIVASFRHPYSAEDLRSALR